MALLLLLEKEGNELKLAETETTMHKLSTSANLVKTKKTRFERKISFIRLDLRNALIIGLLLFTPIRLLCQLTTA